MPTLVRAVRVLRYPATGISGLRVSLVGEALGLLVGSPLAPSGAAEVPHAAASSSASASVKRLRRRGNGALVTAGSSTPLSYLHAAAFPPFRPNAHCRRAQ